MDVFTTFEVVHTIQILNKAIKYIHITHKTVYLLN